jgi:hypothetical protein
MKETKLLGAILPANPEFIPILNQIREKYNIPENRPAAGDRRAGIGGICAFGIREQLAAARAGDQRILGHTVKL